MQFCAEHCFQQSSSHCWPYPRSQASQYRVVQGLVHESAAWLQSQLPVQVPLALHCSITEALQLSQPPPAPLQSPLHFAI